MLIPLIAALAAAAPAQNGVFGTWANPSNSVVVRTGRCGNALCGRVIWASPKARDSAARNGGVRQLIGLNVLRDYHPVGPRRWAGHAFVPDLGTEFDSELTQTGPNEIQVEGCRFGGLVCKTQVWHRTAPPRRG